MISLVNFSMGYPGRMLLNNVDCVFDKGKLTALVGRNGCGKSTLLRSIASLSNDYDGNIIIDGKNVRNIHPSVISKTVAFVSTERIRVPNLLCRDLVSLGRAPYTNWIGRMQEKDAEYVADALKIVGMEEFALKSMDKMSDGECQRIMIARALAQQTPVILLDEPTSFIDPPGRHELCELLARLSREQGKTILFSTHELSLAASYADVIAHISPDCKMEKLPAGEFHADSYIKDDFKSF